MRSLYALNRRGKLQLDFDQMEYEHLIRKEHSFSKSLYFP